MKNVLKIPVFLNITVKTYNKIIEHSGIMDGRSLLKFLEVHIHCKTTLGMSNI